MTARLPPPPSEIESAATVPFFFVVPRIADLPKNALVGLAAQTHKEADVNAMTKFVQDFATDLGASS